MSPLSSPFAVLASSFAAARRRLGSWFGGGTTTRPPEREAVAEGEPAKGGSPTAPPAPSPVRLVARVAALSDTGRKREHNEDRPLVQILGGPPLADGQEVSVDLSDDGLVLAVCDGMGGAVAGEVASAIVVETLSERTSDPEAGGLATDVLSPWLVEGVEESNRRALDRVVEEPDLQGMGSTVTSAVLLGADMVLAHVGDSRAYHLRDGTMTQVTEDHSFVAKLVALGRITEEEARDHRQRNLLLQAVGTGGELEVEHTAHRLRVGDRVLLCSDGLTTMVTDEVIRDVLGGAEGPAAQCASLVEMANAGGGLDNITVVVAHLEGVASDDDTVPLPVPGEGPSGA